MKKVCTIIFCIVCSWIFAQVPSAGLIGAWPFSGNANDISGTGNNGVVVGAILTTDRCGNPNSAYSFNGTTNYIQMPFNGPSGSSARSISFWAKTTNTTTGSPRATFSYGAAAGAGVRYEIVWNHCAAGVGLDVGNQALIRGNNCLLDNSWHHIVVIFDPTVSTIYSTVTFYIDGVLQPVITCFVTGITANINTGVTFPITIGKASNSATRFWSGELDDYYLYNRVLTPLEVSQLYMTCPSPIIGNTLVCQGSNLIYNVPLITNATYTWSLPGGWTGTSSTNTISAVAGNTGTITVAASSACKVFPTSTLAVTSVSLPVPSLVSTHTTLCLGKSATLTISGGNSYTWIPLGTNVTSVVVNPVVNTGYTVWAANTINSCSVAISFTQNVSTNPVIAPSSSGSLACVGNTATLSALGAQTYTWLPVNLTGSLINVSPLVTTVYSVTGANAAACTGSATISVLVPTAMTLNIVASPTSACTGTIVVLTASTSGGTPPNTYTWTVGETTNTLEVAEFAGNYIYTVTSENANACLITKTISVNFFNGVTLNTSNKSVCQGSAATFTVSGAATYTWYPYYVGGSTYTVVPAVPTTYTVIGTSAGGCTTSATASVSIKALPVLSISTSSITCGSLGSATVTALTGTGPYSYTWTPSAQTTSVGVNLSTGIHTIAVLDNSTGCTTVTTRTFIPLIPITGTLSATNSLICFGVNTGTASIVLAGNSGVQSYSWTNPAGVQSQATASVLSAGIHTVTVTDLQTACVMTKTFQITQPALFTGGVAPNTTLACVNSSIILSATSAGGTPPHSYTWTNGPTTSFYQLTEPLGGIYTYSVNSSDVNGCAASATIALKFVDYPVIGVNSTTMCFGTFATLTATGAATYLWYPGAFTGSVLNVFPSITSTYAVVGTTLGCTSSNTANVTVYPLPVPGIFSDSKVCENQSINMAAIGTDTYSWSGPNGFNAVGQSAIVNSASMASAGIYTLTATDIKGCVASTSTLINVLANPIPSTGGASVCIGEPATMTVSGGVSYLWNGPGGLASISQFLNIPVVTTNNIGVYTVFVIGTNSCVVTASVPLVGYPYPLPSPTIIATPKACLHSTISLQGLGGDSYLWSGPGNLTSTSSTLTFEAESIGMSGIYTLTAKNTSNCAASTTVLIKVYKQPTATVISSKNNTCVPFCSEFSIIPTQANIAPLKGFYFLNVGGVFSDSTLTTCFYTGENKLIQINYVDTNNCVNTATLIINAFPKPVADFEFYPIEPDANLDKVQFVNLSQCTEPSDWTWYFENDSIPVKEKNPAYIFNFPNKVPVVLMVRNNYGCLDTAIKLIEVDEEISLFVPNIFTPNADGLNDVFQPKGVGIAKYHLEIFDRWGVSMFVSNDLLIPWDGTYRGELGKMDNYIWNIEVTHFSGKTRTYQGTILMVR